MDVGFFRCFFQEGFLASRAGGAAPSLSEQRLLNIGILALQAPSVR